MMSAKVTLPLSFKQQPVCAEDPQSLPVSLETWGGIEDKGVGIVNVSLPWMTTSSSTSQISPFQIPHHMVYTGHPCTAQCVSNHPPIKPLMQGRVCIADFYYWWPGDKEEVYLAAIPYLISNICHFVFTSLHHHFC